MKYCWLANTTGKRDGFHPIDLLQEHNIRDIKVRNMSLPVIGLTSHVKHTFAAVGPYAEWDYIGRMSASIPCQRRVKDHVESDINHFHRGKSHTSPDKEEDVARLQASYHQSGVHRFVRGRKLDAKDKVPDLLAIGSGGGRLSKAIEKWAANRASEWSSKEDWTDY